jgi:H+/Cl- antiporter ClcA
MAALCEPFRNHADQRLFIAAGAGAGVAAAFSAPVGGMLFALEEGGLTWSHLEMWRVLFCSTWAVSTIAGAGPHSIRYYHIRKVVSTIAGASIYPLFSLCLASF